MNTPRPRTDNELALDLDDVPVHDDFPHEELYSEWDVPPVRGNLHGSDESRRKARDEYDAGDAW